MIKDIDIEVVKDNLIGSLRLKTLNAEMLSLIHKNKWFKIWMPKNTGGLALRLEDGLALLEELAFLDGGLSWTITLCSGANLFVGFVDPSVEHLFEDEKICLGGSGQVNGKAVQKADGYEISGYWKYATGAPHLTHFTLNCWIYDGDTKVMDQDGNPVFKSFFIDRDQVLIHNDWDTFGLEITASHSFSVENLFVNKNRSFHINEQKNDFGYDIYRYPFMPFAELTLFVNFMGMFHRYLTLIDKLYRLKAQDALWLEKSGKKLFAKLDQHYSFYATMKDKVYHVARQTYSLVETQSTDEATFDETGVFTRAFVERILAIIMELHLTSGIRGAQREEELNQVFRNIFTASQHSLLQQKN